MLLSGLKEKYLILLLLIFPLVVVNIQAAGYRLEEDDRLSILVWGHQDLSITINIDPDGEISLPLLGKVKAAGLTLAELQELLEEGYSEYIREPQVSLSLLDYKRSQVMVLGQVRNPGTYELEGESRVLHLIAQAGGPTEKAALDQLRLSRGEELLEIDLEGLLTGTGLTGNYLLQDGDVLYLPEEVLEISIYGEVTRSGSYPWREGKRLSELLAEAGNQTTSGDLSRVRISKPDGSVDFVNFLAYLEDASVNNDPVLPAGSSVYIEKKVFEVNILGEVNRPGTYTWHEGMRLDKLLAQAGNQTERGDLGKIKIIHQDGSNELVNLAAYFAAEEGGENPLLQPGDTVKIDEIKGVDWQKVFTYITGAKIIKDFLGLEW